MCDQKKEGPDGICINTACPEHILYDRLYLNHPNMDSLLIWAFSGCMRNISVLREMEKDSWITLEMIGEAWGISRERVRQIEEKALKKALTNFKTITKEETQDGKDSTERSRAIRVTGAGDVFVPWQEGGV